MKQDNTQYSREVLLKDRVLRGISRIFWLLFYTNRFTPSQRLRPLSKEFWKE